jgi:uncharacterized protein
MRNRCSVRTRVETPAQSLCLQCGLCCNGVIFADGQLQSDDHPERLKSLGLNLKRGGKFHQPCNAFTNGCCAIYADRPSYCRKFECALLMRVNAGEIERNAALRTIGKAAKQAAKVRRLLQQLGCVDEHVALNTRFRRITRRIHSGELGEDAASLFGELTLTVHQLNVILSREFYPA